MICLDPKCSKERPAESSGFCIQHLAEEGALDSFLLDQAKPPSRTISISNCQLSQDDLNAIDQSAASLLNNQLLTSQEFNLALDSVTLPREEIVFPSGLAEVFRGVDFKRLTSWAKLSFKAGITPGPVRYSFRENTRFLALTSFNGFRAVIDLNKVTAEELHFQSMNFVSFNADHLHVSKTLLFMSGSWERDVSMLDCDIDSGGLLITGVDIKDDAYLGLFNSRSKFLIENCTVGSRFRINGVTCQDELRVKGCRFEDEAELTGISTSEDGLATITNCTFGSRATIDVSAKDSFSIYDTTFGAQARVLASGSNVCFNRNGFEGGVLQLDTLSMEIDVLRTIGRLVLSSTTPDGETGLAYAGRNNNQSAIRRLSDVDAENLTLSNLDVSSCTFDTVTNLESLRLEGPVKFASRHGLMQSRRSILADEEAWRESHELRILGFVPLPAITRGISSRGLADRLAAQYRSFRKGLEDTGNEPGAADFYYGEMEMRRNGSGTGWEKVLLGAYWAVSGYGLRAWRSLATLVVTLGAASIIFATIGFAPASETGFLVTAGPSTPGTSIVMPTPGRPKPQASYFDAVVFTFRSATTLLRPGNPPPLTRVGEVTDVTLRILSPILIALAALAIRGRVKR